MKTTAEHMHDVADVFVPFLGDFLSIVALIISLCSILCVFVPFLGDFLSMIKRLGAALYGLIVFVPFLGDFLSIYDGVRFYHRGYGFRPLSWGLSFNSVPAKPQPVCSRKRICGGDGGIASSGALLRR